jgi:response regulator of citrate/malate metabolism
MPEPRAATRQSDTQEHAYASWKVRNEEITLKLLVANKKKRERSVMMWTRGEEQALLNLQDPTSTCRNKWVTIAKHPALAGRTVSQMKAKWKNMMCARGLNPRWTKKEEQPLLDLLQRQSNTARTTGRNIIDWDYIAKSCPALADRTVDQVKEKWKAMKKASGKAHGIRSAHCSAKEDARVLQLYERMRITGTEGGSVSVQQSVAQPFPGQAQTAVHWRSNALLRKEDAKKKQAEAVSLITTQRNVNTIDATAAVIHKEEIVHVQQLDKKRPSSKGFLNNTLATKCSTTDGAVNHTEENAQQLDTARLTKRRLKHSEHARSCSDDGVRVGTGATGSDQHDLDRAADNTVVRHAKKRRLPNIMMDMDPHNCNSISEHYSSSHNVATVAEAGSSTSISTSSFKRSSNPKKTPRQQGCSVATPRPTGTSRMASKCDHQNHANWASLCPKLNEEKVNAIISIYWPLFDD